MRRGICNAYAGVPVRIPGVGALGTLCVLDVNARTFSAADLEVLSLLADRVAAEIEWRERGRIGDRPIGTLTYLAMVDEQHGIYNARAFESIAGAVARLALSNECSFGLLGFDRPPVRPWPRPENFAETAALLGALKRMVRPGEIVGRLDDRAFAVVAAGASRAAR